MKKALQIAAIMEEKKKVLLQTHNLTIGYGKSVVQQQLNLTAKPGHLICLLGTNGAGKSTLLRTLAGLQKPLFGDVLINTVSISKLSDRQRSKIFSLVLTDTVNEENMTVFDVASLGRFPYTNWAGTLSSEDKNIVLTAIEQVNLTSKVHAYLHEISDGEKQRAVIAKALTQDTPLVLLDEPTAHLDLPNRIEIMLLLRKLSVNTQKTFILSTHELDLAIQMADNIWLMHPNGIEIGIPEDLMLSGKFQTIFGNDSFYFDQKDGHFSIKPLMGNLQIQLSGEEIPLLWTKHALNRFGIEVVQHAAINVVSYHNRFVVQSFPNAEAKEVGSIEALLEEIQKIHSDTDNDYFADNT
ncbi:MAG: ABC transporter ATP-binding protein [Bacteroidales bacterium]|jgi:iron complex transport system ATP-binding protein|nr:ABC transporter ATP-binding protein [Bacteroidales bacterium]